MSTLPVTPASTASCAAAVCSSGNRCSGSPTCSPTSSAPAATAAVYRGDRIRPGGVGHGVKQHVLPARVEGHEGAYRHGDLVARGAGVRGDDAVWGEHVHVDPGIAGRRHLRDDVNPARDYPADLGHDVLRPVVDQVLRSRGGGQRCLLRAADGGEHGGAGPAGELDGRVADRAGAARDEHRPAGQCARLESPGAVLVHTERAVRGDEWHAEASAEFERRAVRQRHGPHRRQHDVLLGGAARTLMRGQPQPDPLVHAGHVHPVADRVDHARAVLVRHLLGELDRSALSRRQATTGSGRTER